MIGSFIIVFREILEAALVIGVVAAAVKGLAHRGRWVSVGVGLGIAGAALIAAGIGIIARFAHGNGQEIFEAGMLFAAGLMLAWHNIYMARHGRELTQKLKTMGTAVLAGRASFVMLIGVTALATMREGSEIALFLYGIAAGGISNWDLLGGSLIGLAAGAVVGFVLFAGLSRIPIKRLFQVSGWIILFIAAGMIARGAQFLIQAGYLSPLVIHVWDSSAIIAGNSILGRSLGALAGYTPAPALMQIVFWLASFITIGTLMLAKISPFTRRVRTTVTTATSLVLMMGTLSMAAGNAHAADYKVYSPLVVKGENELELRAYNAWGTNPTGDAKQALKLAFGHSFTDWWASELYATAEQEPGENLKLEEFEWENRFQLTPQGKYWMDVGLLNENEIPRFSRDPYEIKFGPTFSKDFYRFTALLNLLATHQYGTNAASGVGLEYRARLEYRWRRTFSPIIEAYGQPAGRIGNYGRPHNAIGPGVTGQSPLGAGKSLRYGVVALLGTSGKAADTTLVLRLEYEFY